MTNYYKKRYARVNLAHLFKIAGWEIYGYKPDESDAMTDYFSPANWDGIATKGKYIAVIDNKDKTGYEIFLNAEEYVQFKNAELKLTRKDKDKIDKLQRLADKTNFEGEKNQALNMIEKLKNKKYDIVEVEVIKKYINFPSANYMIFIWDTEAQAIVYKSKSLTDWDIDDLTYNHYIKFENGQAYGNIDKNRLKHHFRYTENDIKKKEQEINNVCEKTNNFLEMLENLDNLKKVYRYTDSGKNTEVQFVKINKPTFDQIIEEKLIMKYFGNLYTIADIKERVNKYNGKHERFITYQKIKKDGTPYKNARSEYFGEYKLKNYTNYYEFGRLETVNKFEWKLQPRSRQLTQPKKSDIIVNINNERRVIEIKEVQENLINKIEKIGFKWSNYYNCWWAFYTEAKLQELKKAVG